MLYLIHCSFTQGGLTPSHGHFDYVVDAPDIASAKDRLRAKLDEERAEGRVMTWSGISDLKQKASGESPEAQSCGGWN